MLTMLDEGGLDFGRGQSVARDVDNVVNTATDPVVAFMIAAGSVTSEL